MTQTTTDPARLEREHRELEAWAAQLIGDIETLLAAWGRRVSFHRGERETDLRELLNKHTCLGRPRI